MLFPSIQRLVRQTLSALFSAVFLCAVCLAALSAAGAASFGAEIPAPVPAPTLILDAGWPCGEENRSCAHIWLKGSDALLCIPAETRDGCLMIPFTHFQLIAGCGLETDGEGLPCLVKYDQVYRLTAGSAEFSRDEETLTFPVAPYEAHGRLYLPLRALCEAMSLDIRWLPDSDTVFLHSPWVEADTLLPALTGENQALLAVMEKEELPYGAEPVELVVTFYYSSDNPAYTASGNPAAAGSIAADAGIPFDTQYYIPELDFIREDGIFTVHDRGSSIKGSTIDVFLPNALRKDPEVAAALRRGRYGVTAYPIPSGE